MTDERTLSRRDSLRSIATTGALVGGTGFGLGTAAAGAGDKEAKEEKKHEKGKDDEKDKESKYADRVDFDGCDAAFVRFQKTGELPTHLRFVTYNAVDERIEHVAVTVTGERLREFARYGGDWTYEFNVYQFYDRPADSGDKVLAVAIDGELVANANECAEAPVATVEDEDATIDYDKLSFEAVCVDTQRETARFRVVNDNERLVELEFDIAGSDREGTVSVPGKSATYFEVDATTSDGAATLYFYHGSNQLAVVGSNQDKECIPRGRLNLTAQCLEICENRTLFRVINNESVPLSPTFRLPGTDSDAVVTVPGNRSIDVWIGTTNPNLVAQLFYEGELLDGTEMPEERCDEDADLEIDPEEIELEAIHYDHDERAGVFRATNLGDGQAPLEWRIVDTDVNGYVCVPGETATDFWVPLGEKPEDGVTVALYDDDEQLAEATIFPTHEDREYNKEEKKKKKGHGDYGAKKKDH
ncbi:hypothetical protein [Halobiforma nitratireducens]|uniref:Uncharacterized protein n=1 Tax=Halobiforma nitratireducens JCM 10879 TaxID=1227454 RepID=M0MCX2_9EURY|nr:hypothetical protein [Halobiforma nitratireducens]EMA42255.1 hypothetical protein C446_04410 [Halobiforma nitratireducens JCM 10879]